MTPHQIGLVQKTWALAEPLGDTVTTLFYGRLFELDPSLRALFRKNMLDQGRSLRVMLSMVTAGLTQPEQLMPVAVKCRRSVATSWPCARMARTASRTTCADTSPRNTAARVA